MATDSSGAGARRAMAALGCAAWLAAPSAEARRLDAWPAPADTTSTLAQVLERSEPGDTIVLRPGLYRGTFTLRHGVSLLGAAGPDSTILDADGGRYVLFGRHLDSTTVISGLTLRGGRRPHPNSGGGGIYLHRSSPLVLGNVIHGNLGYLGPAVYMNYECHPVIAFNLLRDNEGYLGGAVAAYERCDPLLYNNIVQDNRAVSGGGVLCLHASAVLVGNTLVANRTEQHGGGGAIYADGSAMLAAGNALAHNRDDHPRGGAVFCRGTPVPELRDNLFWENEGGEGGGACDSLLERDGNCAADPGFEDLATRKLVRRRGAGETCAPQAGAVPWDLARPPAVPDSILALWRAWRREHGTH